MENSNKNVKTYSIDSKYQRTLTKINCNKSPITEPFEMVKS